MPLSQQELDELKAQFQDFDKDGDGHITEDELAVIMERLGEKVSKIKLKEMIAEVDEDSNGTIEWDEFTKIWENHNKGKGSAFGKTVDKHKKVVSVKTEHAEHSFSEEEKVAFVDWINSSLGKDPDLKHLIPLKLDDDSLFRGTRDGILLCKLINSAVPDTIDERVINKAKGGVAPNVYKIHENQNLSINSAKAIGCNVTNLGAQDLIEGRAHLVLGLIWQIVKIGLLSSVNLANHPELYRLLQPGETLEDLLKLPADQILLRWFNYHLAEAGHPRRVKNFGGDIKDSECYTILLKQIAPKTAGVDTKALAEKDDTKRAGIMLENADKINCRKFVQPKDVVAGNTKLNLAFVANLFNNYPALEPVEEVIEIIEETREEKAYRNWMNSLGVDPSVNNIYDDLCDGIILLQLFDKVQPGCVNWKKVNRPPWKKIGGAMKQLENCNYAVNLAKDLKFSVVGIAGSDINTCNKKLILAIVWQLMRAYVLAILKSLSDDNKPIADSEICQWANDKLKDAGKKTSVPAGFKHSSLSDGLAIIDTIEGSVDPKMVTKGDNPKDALLNAKYAISSGRKIGAEIFALPEDIVEVKPKMLLTLFAALMAVDLGRKRGGTEGDDVEALGQSSS